MFSNPIYVLSFLLFIGCSASTKNMEPQKKELAAKLESVKIGDQVWTSKNLSVDTFRNGDTIPEAKTHEEWVQYGIDESPAWCGYIHTDEQKIIYGKKYNWFAVNDPRGLAPTGWHVASYNDWLKLVAYAGGEKTAGDKLKSKTIWATGSNGEDLYGFNTLPAGEVHVDGDTSSVGMLNSWWTSTANNDNLRSGQKSGEFAYQIVQYYFDSKMRVTNSYTNIKGGCSVRCVRN